MKTFVLIICIFITFAGCQNGEANVTTAANDTSNYTSIQWIDSVKNIGIVTAGTKTEITFRFKNTGTKPLFIIAARPGCGCTIADYPKEAIAPNGEGVITANYNIDEGAQGEFRKNITVNTNTKERAQHNIFFYGNIKKANDSTTAKINDTK